MRNALSILVGLALLLAPAFADVNAAELDWLGTIPGVTALTVVNGGTHVERTFQVDRAADTFNAILVGLQDHGWHIVNGVDQENAHASYRSLEAVKNGQHLVVAVPTLDVGGTMHVTLAEAGRERTVGVIPGDYASSIAIVNVDHQTLNVNVQGTDATIAGSYNHVVISGRCKTLMVNGHDNDVHVEGRIARIDVNGATNHIAWSSSQNVNPPVVVNNGAENIIATSP